MFSKPNENTDATESKTEFFSICLITTMSSLSWSPKICFNIVLTPIRMVYISCYEDPYK